MSYFLHNSSRAEKAIMGLISQVSEKLTGSSHKTEPSEHVEPGTDEKIGAANASSAAGTTGTHNTSVDYRHIQAH